MITQILLSHKYKRNLLNFCKNIVVIRSFYKKKPVPTCIFFLCSKKSMSQQYKPIQRRNFNSIKGKPANSAIHCKIINRTLPQMDVCIWFNKTFTSHWIKCIFCLQSKLPFSVYGTEIVQPLIEYSYFNHSKFTHFSFIKPYYCCIQWHIC